MALIITLSANKIILLLEIINHNDIYNAADLHQPKIHSNILLLSDALQLYKRRNNHKKYHP